MTCPFRTDTRVATMSGLFMMFFPSFQQNMLFFSDGAKDFWNLVGGKAVVFGENNGRQPEFRFKVVPRDMDVRWFSRLARIEVKSVGAFS